MDMAWLCMSRALESGGCTVQDMRDALQTEIKACEDWSVIETDVMASWEWINMSKTYKLADEDIIQKLISRGYCVKEGRIECISPMNGEPSKSQ